MAALRRPRPQRAARISRSHNSNLHALRLRALDYDTVSSVAPMSRNLEIKCVLRDVQKAIETAARLSGGRPQVIQQTDVFFPGGPARLKLRILGPGFGELIRYQRPDGTEPRISEYSIARTSDPYVLLQILSEALGAIGTVEKKRLVFLVGQTRIHIDRVEGLGDFLEFEVVLRPEQTEAEGYEIVRSLTAEFGLDPSQLVAQAYIDLLRSR
jgi:predicted adenylyl cyclase CyaB